MDVNFISPYFVFTDNATQKNAVHVFFLFVEVNLPAIFIEMRMLRQGVDRVTSFLDIPLHRGFINLNPPLQYIRVPDFLHPAQQSMFSKFSTVANLICEK